MAVLVLKCAQMDGMISRDEFKGAIASLTATMIQLDRARAEASEMRHRSIGETLQRILNDQSAIRGDLRQHADDDEEVATRVTLLEEGAKRIVWVSLVGIPSAIAAWEGLKRFLGK